MDFLIRPFGLHTPENLYIVWLSKRTWLGFFQKRVVHSILAICDCISIFSELILCPWYRYLPNLFQLTGQSVISHDKKHNVLRVEGMSWSLDIYKWCALFRGVSVAQPLVFLFAVYLPIVKLFVLFYWSHCIIFPY